MTNILKNWSEPTGWFYYLDYQPAQQAPKTINTKNSCEQIIENLQLGNLIGETILKLKKPPIFRPFDIHKYKPKPGFSFLRSLPSFLEWDFSIAIVTTLYQIQETQSMISFINFRSRKPEPRTVASIL